MWILFHLSLIALGHVVLDLASHMMIDGRDAVSAARGVKTGTIPSSVYICFMRCKASLDARVVLSVSSGRTLCGCKQWRSW